MENALYYPHIALKNPQLIKAMALYYDNIYRIVPSHIEPNDPEELKPLLEDGRIGKKINPIPYVSETSHNFLEKKDEWRAAALSHNDDSEEPIVRLHMEKTDEHVRNLFREAGFEEDHDWMQVPTRFASNYMLYMANEIASRNNLSLITGDWGAWTGTTYFGINGRVDEFITAIGIDDRSSEDESFGLFGLLINNLSPVNISSIPANKIVEFRQRRKDEIEQFRHCVQDLREELLSVEEHDIRVDIIKQKAEDLAKAQKDYQKSADIINARKWFGTSFMGFPAPLSFCQFFSLPAASTVALTATGLALGGIFNIHNAKEEIKNLNKKNPASFLIELNRSFKNYTWLRGGGDINFHAYNCMEEYVND